MTIKKYVVIGTIIVLLISTAPLTNANATENPFHNKEADLPICVYKVIKDCKTKSGLICEADTDIDPCKISFMVLLVQMRTINQSQINLEYQTITMNGEK
jgi:hypothetical protein